jgi:hypothetical protein
MCGEMKIISRQEAKVLGLKRYFTGKPCKYGHICERSFSRGCFTCEREKTRERRRYNPEQHREQHRRWREKNREYHLARCRYYAQQRSLKLRRALAVLHELGLDL